MQLVILLHQKDHSPLTTQNAIQQANYFNNNFDGPSYEYKEKGKLFILKIR